MNTILVGILLAVFGLAYLWVKRRFSFWTDRGFLQAETIFPFGSIKGMGTKITLAECMNNHYKRFKGKTPAVGFYSFLSPQLLPIEPELIKDILVREFQSFHDRGFYYNKEDDPISANILTLDGQEWKDRRVKFTPVFTSGKMKMMFEIIDGISEKFVASIERDLAKSSVCEMRSWCQRFTNDNIGNVAFGIDTKCLDDINSEFMTMGRRLFELTPFEAIKFAIASAWPDLARKLGVLLSPKEVGDFFLNAFLQTFENRQKNPAQRNDFVQMLLNLSDKFTPNELAAEAFLVYSGGFETSATTIQFALYELALNSELQDRLRREITEGMEANDGKLTYDMLFGFKYLNMVVQESLRKYPPIPNVFRKCKQDFRIPNTDMVIPKETSIIINTFSLHHDPEYFADPEKFDPERFSDENVGNIRPYTYMPFATGPRNCLGERFGLMQAKIGVAKLVKNFSFAPCERTTVPIKFVPPAPFLSPVGGIHLQVTRVK